ncbi:MAG: hypothetical protein IT350_17080 [Deltaproteobacteria bacterium]|nr:hypothetical protein [Deltaproteobacteria bacterium]
MKVRLVIAMCLVFWTLPARAQDGFALDATRIDASGFDLDLRVTDWSIERDGAFTRVVIPGAGSTGTIGGPELPAIRRWMQVPDGATIRVRVIAVETIWVPVGLIAPRRDFTTDLESPATLAFDPHAYFAPDRSEPIVRAGRGAVMGGVRARTLAIDPVIYDAARGEAEIVTRLRAEIRFSKPLTIIRGRSKAQRLAATLLNFDPLRFASAPARDDAPVTLVLHDDAFEGDASLDDLVAAHETEGPVEAVAVADGADPEAIYATIASAYAASDPPVLTTVLLVGDASATGIPFRMGTTGRIADAPYSFLDGDDLLADVDLGRLPAKDSDELANMTSKTLAWLDGDLLDGDWLSRALLVAHAQGYPFKYTAACEEIRTAAYALPPPDFVPVYGGEGATNATLLAAIDDGAFLITYRGHGLVEEWAEWSSEEEDFDVDDVALIDTGGRPGVVLDVACDNADLNQEDPSFAEAWIAHPDAAVAFLGSVYASYTVPNDQFSRFLFTAMYDDGLARLGDILAVANANLAAYYADDDMYRPYANKNIEMYLWLGDPAIELPIDRLVAPDDLAARATTSRSVLVTWRDRALNEVGYRVWRQAAHEKTPRLVGEVGADRVRFEDRLVRRGVRYSYSVEAWRDAESKMSRRAAVVRVP